MKRTIFGVPTNNRQRGALEVLIVATVEHGQSTKLSSFPFIGLHDNVDDTLLRKAEEVVDIAPFPSYHKILFSWRIQHGDFQGGKSPNLHKLIIYSCICHV